MFDYRKAIMNRICNAIGMVLSTVPFVATIFLMFALA